MEEETKKEELQVVEGAKTATKITYDDFKKVEITLGKILSAEKIDGSEKLLKLMVSFAEPQPRQIISGIQKYFPDESVLVNQKCMFVTNLEPRKMMGMESNGMLFAVGGARLPSPAGSANGGQGDVPFSFMTVDETVPEGTKAN